MNASEKSLKVLIVGANSAIAQACVSIYAQEKATLTLVGRDSERIQALCVKAKALGASAVNGAQWDFSRIEGLSDFIQDLWTKVGGFDQVLICHGILPAPDKRIFLEAELDSIVRVNYTSVVVILQALEKFFLISTKCNIGVITSVAGDRGRQSNYLYGSTKAALSVYVEGLTHKYAQTDIRFVTIKPGFVDTPMTRSFKKGPLWAKPEKVAGKIVAALNWNHRGTLYTPSFWRYIMCLVRSLPNFLFWRTKL